MQTIDASKSIEEVHEEILTVASAVIENVKDKEISRLWVNDEFSRPAKRPCPEGAIDKENSKRTSIVYFHLLFRFFLNRTTSNVGNVVTGCLSCPTEVGMDGR